MPDSFSADFNHPMAYYRARLSVDIISVEYYSDPRGGLLKDYGEILGDGPGMQARYRGLPTDFFSESEAFSRENEENDHSFYEKARLVTHVDEQACKIIEDIYGQLLQPEMRVLDLMTRWKSYVPKKIEPISLVGLGLNEEELAANKQLISRHIHDLNTRPVLPFNDGSFDAVICSASVEYLTHPLKIFSEVSRILRPGGLFVHTFSDRWFPPKVIQLWKDLHPFERVGFVTECFLRTGLFERLFTLSVQGWPRPLTDRHYPSLKTSDPVFAVWGYKKE
jgi:SAM-dependent methyltransferase